MPVGGPYVGALFVYCLLHISIAAALHLPVTSFPEPQPLHLPVTSSPEPQPLHLSVTSSPEYHRLQLSGTSSSKRLLKPRHCNPSRCVHGVCADSAAAEGLACYCENGFTGERCDRDADQCLSSPCLNGGSCSDTQHGFVCSCTAGYNGSDCSLTVDECESAACLNGGSCIYGTGSRYACLCTPGYAGVRCQHDISVCQRVSPPHIRCHNGGICIDGDANKYHCECAPGFTGATCVSDIDDCSSSPCPNGATCIDKVNSFHCVCPSGLTGRLCESRMEACADVNPCENAALCVVVAAQMQCYCRPDYHGIRCQSRYDNCLPQPRCLHGGTCVDLVNDYSCLCPDGTSGRHCQCASSADGIGYCVAPDFTDRRVSGIHTRYNISIEYATLTSTSGVVTETVVVTPIMQNTGGVEIAGTTSLVLKDLAVSAVLPNTVLVHGRYPGEEVVTQAGGDENLSASTLYPSFETSEISAPVNLHNLNESKHDVDSSLMSDAGSGVLLYPSIVEYDSISEELHPTSASLLPNYEAISPTSPLPIATPVFPSFTPRIHAPALSPTLHELSSNILTHGGVPDVTPVRTVPVMVTHEVPSLDTSATTSSTSDTSGSVSGLQFTEITETMNHTSIEFSTEEISIATEEVSLRVSVVPSTTGINEVIFELSSGSSKPTDEYPSEENINVTETPTTTDLTNNVSVNMSTEVGITQSTSVPDEDSKFSTTSSSVTTVIEGGSPSVGNESTATYATQNDSTLGIQVSTQITNYINSTEETIKSKTTSESPSTSLSTGTTALSISESHMTGASTSLSTGTTALSISESHMTGASTSATTALSISESHMTGASTNSDHDSSSTDAIWNNRTSGMASSTAFSYAELVTTSRPEPLSSLGSTTGITYVTSPETTSKIATTSPDISEVSSASKSPEAISFSEGTSTSSESALAVSTTTQIAVQLLQANITASTRAIEADYQTSKTTGIYSFSSPGNPNIDEVTEHFSSYLPIDMIKPTQSTLPVTPITTGLGSQSETADAFGERASSTSFPDSQITDSGFLDRRDLPLTEADTSVLTTIALEPTVTAAPSSSAGTFVTGFLATELGLNHTDWFYDTFKSTIRSNRSDVPSTTASVNPDATEILPATDSDNSTGSSAYEDGSNTQSLTTNEMPYFGLPIRFFRDSYMILEGGNYVPMDVGTDAGTFNIDGVHRSGGNGQHPFEYDDAEKPSSVFYSDGSEMEKQTNRSEAGAHIMNVTISFASLSASGSVLASAPLGFPPWLHVFLHDGMLRTEFSCSGHQYTQFMETNVRVNTGRNVTVRFTLIWAEAADESRPQCYGSLLVSGSDEMTAQQFADLPLVRKTALVIGSQPQKPGFSGYLLDLEVDGYRYSALSVAVADGLSRFKSPCDEIQCRNNGTCRQRGWMAVTCQCPAGYSGAVCESSVCGADLCAAGSLCLRHQDGTISCRCPLYTSGDRCRSEELYPSDRYMFAGSEHGYSSHLSFNISTRLRRQFWMYFHLHVQRWNQTSLLAAFTGRRDATVNVREFPSRAEYMSTSSTTTLGDPPLASLPTMDNVVETTSRSSTMESASPQNMKDVLEKTTSPPNGPHQHVPLNEWRQSAADFFVVSLSSGYVTVTWDLGSGSARLMSEAPLDSSLDTQTVRIGRRGQRVWLQVNTQKTQTAKSPGKYFQLNTANILYIGGHPSYKHHDLPGDLRRYGGFEGCLFDLRIGTNSHTGERLVPQYGFDVTSCPTKGSQNSSARCSNIPAWNITDAEEENIAPAGV